MISGLVWNDKTKLGKKLVIFNIKRIIKCLNRLSKNKKSEFHKKLSKISHD